MNAEGLLTLSFDETSAHILQVTSLRNREQIKILFRNTNEEIFTCVQHLYMIDIFDRRRLIEKAHEKRFDMKDTCIWIEFVRYSRQRIHVLV